MLMVRINSKGYGKSKKEQQWKEKGMYGQFVRMVCSIC